MAGLTACGQDILLKFTQAGLAELIGQILSVASVSQAINTTPSNQLLIDLQGTRQKIRIF